jgi:hypothetical protein
MNPSVELEVRGWPEIRVSQDVRLNRHAQPSTRSEHQVSSGATVIAALWWGLLAYAVGHALLSSG